MTCGKLNYWFLALCKKTTAGSRKIVATTTTRIVWKIRKPELGIGTEIRDHQNLDCLENQETGISIEIGT